ncbi:MAG TPA: L-type lectin-domain containing protein [Myxococcota bacterium]|nr:L-type lectin-domain containing protein [Myxococcota bacterium]
MRWTVRLASLAAACQVPQSDSVKFGDEVGVETDPPAHTEEPDTTPAPRDTAPGELVLEVVDNPEIVELGRDAPPIHLRVTGTEHPDQLLLAAMTDRDGEVPAPTWDAALGLLVLTTEAWTAGDHHVRVEAVSPEGASGHVGLDVGICTWPALEDFTTSVIGNGWIVFGDAAWDPSGWLEITGNAQSRAGAIYKIDRRINPGDFRMEFDIATGGGINTGADGYAVNIINAADERELRAIVEASGNGGCLGYGTVTGCSTWGPIEAFHVEFDTWYNGEAHIQDPTQDNHVAINLDGSPGGHFLWAAVPTLEDLVWRHIAVQIRGSRVQVAIDGRMVMNDVIPGFSFDGGYIGVSGSTGWATNFHRFDNLQLYDRCLVPL